MNGPSLGNGVYLYRALQVIFALQGCIHPFTIAEGRTTNQDPGVTVHIQTLTACSFGSYFQCLARGHFEA